MSVMMVQIIDRHSQMQLPPQDESNCSYPTIAYHCTREIQGPELIKRWVDLIRNTRRH
ncbi:MAG TPA: hypothetical protein VF531_02750 [Bacillota bacterium]